VLKSYRQLWSLGDTPIVNKITGWLLFLFVVVLPILLGVGIYDKTILFTVVGGLAGCAGVILFFNVRHFATFIFPAIYVIIVHKFQLIMTGLLAVSFLVGMLRDNRISVKIPYLFLLLLVFIVGFWGLFRAIDFSGALDIYRYVIVVPFLTYLIFYNLQLTTEQIRMTIWVVIVLSALVGLLTLGLYFKTGISRIVFAWPNHNRLSGFFGLLIPYALVFFLYQGGEKRTRLMWGGLLACLAIGVMVAQTRAILASTVVTAVYITYMMRSWRAFWVFASVLLIALAVAPTLILGRFAEMNMASGGGDADASTMERFQIYLYSFALLPEYWIGGMGLGNFGKIVQARFGFEVPGAQPHNIFLYWIFSYGIVGCLVYCSLILTVIIKGHNALIKAIRLNPEKNVLWLTTLGVNGGLVNLMVAGWLDTYIGVPAIAAWFWILMAYQIQLTDRLKDRFVNV